MGMKEKQVGGSGTGLGHDFASWLQQGLNTGYFGAGSPAGYGSAGTTMGISGVLNDILSGGAGKLGGSLGQLLQTQQANDIGNLRSRFGVGGGTAFGTPGQYAEAQYRSQVASQIATQVGGLQLQALMPLLGLLGGTANRDIPQAESVLQPSGFSQFASIAAPVAGALLGGPLGASIGSGLGSFFGNHFGGGGGMGSDPLAGFNFNSPMLSGLMPQQNTMSGFGPLRFY